MPLGTSKKVGYNWMCIGHISFWALLMLTYKEERKKKKSKGNPVNRPP
jgi:hypothetical protein